MAYNRLSVAANLDKYKQASTTPWILLVSIDFEGETLRLVRDPDDYLFNGETFSAFGFELDEVRESSGRELPIVTLRVSNVNRIAESKLQQHRGGIGAKVTFYLVPDGLSVGEPDLQMVFYVISASSDHEWVHFTIGAENPKNLLFPKFIYIGGTCRHVFNSPALRDNLDPRGVPCGYQGNETECDRSLSRCRELNNTLRFGGFPAINTQGFRNAQIV